MKLSQSEFPRSNWNVVYTYPNSEKKIQRCLSDKKINCFLPLQKVTKQWSDRKKTLEIPLFPNYIFVNTNSANRFEVLSTPGVAKYVSFDGSPVVVSEDEIDLIKRMLSKTCLAVEQTFTEGDLVIIKEGPFEVLFGTLIERKGKSRLGIKIEALNKILSIEICTSVVRRVCDCRLN